MADFPLKETHTQKKTPILVSRFLGQGLNLFFQAFDGVEQVRRDVAPFGD